MPAQALEHEIHIWTCDLEDFQDDDLLSKCKSLLSRDELERYRRFHFEKDRQSYLITHALLRTVLSQYVDVEASSWQFFSNEHGKPEINSPSAAQNLHFNITHTDGFSACAIATESIVGVDAEKTYRKNNLKAISKKMFADQELHALKQKSDFQKQFFYYWTLREAYVKALGTGLSGSSKDFYFEISHKNLTAEICGKNSSEDTWQFQLFEPTAEHVMSVAYASKNKIPINLIAFDERLLVAAK